MHRWSKRDRASWGLIEPDFARYYGGHDLFHARVGRSRSRLEQKHRFFKGAGDLDGDHPLCLGDCVAVDLSVFHSTDGTPMRAFYKG
jgi:hypothetical protein